MNVNEAKVRLSNLELMTLLAVQCTPLTIRGLQAQLPLAANGDETSTARNQLRKLIAYKLLTKNHTNRCYYVTPRGRQCLHELGRVSDNGQINTSTTHDRAKVQNMLLAVEDPNAMVSNQLRPHPVQKKVNVNSIDHISYNPEGRMIGKRFARLKESIRLHGQETPIDVVLFPSGRYKTPDGNCRLQALRELGESMALVNIIQLLAGETPEEALVARWEHHNSTAKPHNGTEKIEVALRGGPVIDPSTKNALRHLKAWWGLDKALTYLLPFAKSKTMMGLSTPLINVTKNLLKAEFGEESLFTPDARNRARQFMIWMIDHNMLRDAIAFFRRRKQEGTSNYPLKGLLRSIDKNLAGIPKITSGFTAHSQKRKYR